MTPAVMATGTLTILEPMSTGDVIDRAVRLYRRNFTPLVAIVAVPSLAGYITSLLFWFGYSRMLMGVEPSSQPAGVPAEAMIMMAAGGLGYPVWLFLWLATIAGLSRVIGDHIMLGESVSFRKCFDAVRRRLGDVILMGLLSIVVMVVLTMTLWLILFALVLAVTVLAGVMGAAGLSSWIVGTLMTIAVLAAVGVGIFIALHVLARVVFLPQVVMLEGQSAGSALGRAMRLGKGNWYRVGGIAIFTYFVSLSLLSALTLPAIAVLYMLGMLTAEFIVSPTWNILYTAFGQISNLLVLPIWIVSFTLLYFDSRVRRENYDLELLAREVAPGFYWQPAAPLPQVASQPARTFIQTGPLGLGGYSPVGRLEPAESQSIGPGSASLSCKKCGALFEPNAGFCIRCGSPA